MKVALMQPADLGRTRSVYVRYRLEPGPPESSQAHAMPAAGAPGLYQLPKAWGGS